MSADGSRTNPKLPDWKDELYGRLAAQVGPGVAWLLVFSLAVLIALTFFLVKNWKDVRNWRVVRFVAESIAPLPRAVPGEYSVLVAKLDDDIDGSYEKPSLESLVEVAAVRVFRLGRHITPSGADLRLAHEGALKTAQTYLRKTGGQIVLWGSVITVNGKGIPKLH